PRRALQPVLYTVRAVVPVSIRVGRVAVLKAGTVFIFHYLSLPVSVRGTARWLLKAVRAQAMMIPAKIVIGTIGSSLPNSAAIPSKGINMATETTRLAGARLLCGAGFLLVFLNFRKAKRNEAYSRQ